MKLLRGYTKVFRRLMGDLRPNRMDLILTLVCSLLVTLCQLYIPVLCGHAVDTMIGAGGVRFDLLRNILLRILVCSCLLALSQWVMTACSQRLSFGVSFRLRNRLIRKIQTLPLSYLDTHPSGDMVSRMITDVENISEGMLMGLTQLFTGLTMIIGVLIIMARLSLGVSAVVVGMTPLGMATAAFIVRRTSKYFKKQSVIRGKETALIHELMDGQKVVQAFGYEKGALERFDEVNEELRDASMKATFFSSLTNPSTRMVNNLVYAVVCLVCSLLAIRQSITIGEFSIFLSYAGQYAKPFNEISGVITELQNSVACSERVFEILDTLEEDVSGEKEYQAVGNVSLDHVSFRYREDVPLIDDFSLDVRKGQRIAIVGPTGCGKTTLINLLMRFYDVHSGTISLDGKDIRTLSRSALRANWGMVLQDTWLKSGTVRENIAFGHREASEEEIIQAAKDAHIDGFIRQLPKGYDTEIAENGANLSQGQKQLLCIARVMLALPPMLILDEATSSIDTRTEILIQRAFSRMMKGRTSFIVAHRLSTIREADTILVMKSGHLVEMGNHRSLMDQNGFYAELYNSQFSGAEAAEA